MKRVIIAAALMLAFAARAFDASPLLQFVTWTPAVLAPTAWYKAEGDEIDSSGNSYTGTWVRGSAAYTNGLLGQAFYFDRSRQISIGNPTAMQNTNRLSVALWVKAETQSDAAAYPIAKHSGWAFGVSGSDGASGTFRVFYNNATLVGNATAFAGYQQVWTHIAFTYDSPYTRAYINGREVWSSTTFSTSIETAASLIIGGRSASSFLAFSGAIDDVLIFNRALTSAEIFRLYQWRQ